MTSRVPEDFHTITPHLVVKGVAAAIAWYERALGAHELLRNPAPDPEKIMHAELGILAGEGTQRQASAGVRA
jgi:PhnB protein